MSGLVVEGHEGVDQKAETSRGLELRGMVL